MLVNLGRRLFLLSDAIGGVGYKYSRLTYSSKRYWTCYGRLIHSEHGKRNVEIKDRIFEQRKPPWDIMFFGTDEFALESLVALHNEQKSESGLIGKLEVVSVSLKKIVPAVSRYCRSEGLVLKTWPVVVPAGAYDIGVVVSFGHLLPESIINAFPLGILNVHGSLLPRWRGAAPIIHALLNGDQETGVTVMKIQPGKFDVGEIVSQASIPISWNTMSGILTKQLADLGAHELITSLKGLPGNLQAATPQPNNGVTKAPKVKEESSRINWEKHTCRKLQAMYRALDDYFPLWTLWHGTPVKLRDMVMHEEWSCFVPNNREKCNKTNNVEKEFTFSEKTSNTKCKNEDVKSLSPGCTVFNKKTKVLSVQCADGCVSFKKVIVKGRKPMSAKDFYNGFISKKTRDLHAFDI
ncbi:methionyl-tRNA formyltransferase, mitochondrial-like [Penaeus chinensis]|uniref:methionyl-tRNA formyltransferase, mitochondrial-like n=1 Tax=Penaeus chinensis TaxID=139456 RepID=UPI001FB85117|nr:methionyl-tRNA formyltransferase, mitochondrial-like [Penaeus chinensis]